MIKTIKLTLRLPGEVHRKLKKRARETQTSLNQVMVEAIRRGLEQPPPEESERDKVTRALREAGLLSTPSINWPEVDPDKKPLAYEELWKELEGLPPLSEMVIEDRGPR